MAYTQTPTHKSSSRNMDWNRHLTKFQLRRLSSEFFSYSINHMTQQWKNSLNCIGFFNLITFSFHSSGMRFCFFFKYQPWCWYCKNYNVTHWHHHINRLKIRNICKTSFGRYFLHKNSFDMLVCVVCSTCLLRDATQIVFGGSVKKTITLQLNIAPEITWESLKLFPISK